MSSIELTSSQKSILTALINLYGEREDAVKGEAIADEVDRNPGTIRNQMQSLKALQLVEGVPGPKGGYKPTSNAYEALDIQRMDEPANVPIFHEGEEMRGSTSTGSTSPVSTIRSCAAPRSTFRDQSATSTKATPSPSGRRRSRSSLSTAPSTAKTTPQTRSSCRSTTCERPTSRLNTDTPKKGCSGAAHLHIAERAHAAARRRDLRNPAHRDSLF